MFRKAIDRIKKAHNKELDWVRNVAKQDTKAHLERRFGEASQALKAECSIVIDQFEALTAELKQTKSRQLALQRHLLDGEMRLA